MICWWHEDEAHFTLGSQMVHLLQHLYAGSIAPLVPKTPALKSLGLLPDPPDQQRLLR
jgi:hypothetical protein